MKTVDATTMALGMAFVGFVGGMLVESSRAPAPSSVQVKSVAPAPAPEPLTRSISLTPEQENCLRYCSIPLPGSDRFVTIDLKRPEHMQNMGGIAQPEFSE